MQRPLTPFEGTDIRSLLDERASTRGDHPFLIWEPLEGEGQSTSYRQFAEAVRRFAAGLEARGVVPSERILIHLDNCPEFLVAWLGCAYAGAVPVTTNARSTLDELSYFAAHSRAVAAITQPAFADLVRVATPSVRWRAVTPSDTGRPATAKVDGFEPLATIDGDPAALGRRPHDPWAHFGIQYTSGTTARPKAVLWTHANALWGARLCAEHEDLRADDIHLTFLPLFHTNAQVYSVLASLWVGATVVLMPRFHVLDDAGNPVAPGETGNLAVRGERGVSLFLEYADNPEATAAAFDANGLFLTGDRVRLGTDGFLYFSDRAKDMLKVGGENVAASEIEAAIVAVEGVAEAAVVAMPHPMLDEVPAAFVIARSGAAPDLADRIQKRCEEVLASFKRPHVVRIVEALPRSTLEKVAKAELRAMLAAERKG